MPRAAPPSPSRPRETARLDEPARRSEAPAPGPPTSGVEDAPDTPGRNVLASAPAQEVEPVPGGTPERPARSSPPPPEPHAATPAKTDTEQPAPAARPLPEPVPGAGAEPSATVEPGTDAAPTSEPAAAPAEPPTPARSENAARTPAPTARPTAAAAAWLDRLVERAPRPLTAQWQTLEIALPEGEGTVSVRARREDEAVAVAVHFSDPRLRGIAGAHADRLQEALRAQYDADVTLSLLNDSAGGSGGHRHDADGGAARHGRRSPAPAAAAPAPAPSSPRPTHPGSAREWIG